jgi:choline dehydrogenase-like flavoprotein
VDIAIMGAGAAGSLLAARLAAAGKSVVVLEAGPPWTLDDLVSSQIWARRIKWGGPAVLRGGSDPVGHNMSAGWGFGGAALHHYASWPRLQPSDFRMASEHGRGLDWPIGYDDLRPHYDRVQDEVGIAGDAAKEVWRPRGAPYPMPPLQAFAQGQILTAGFEKLGLRVGPAPMAVTSTEYKARPACIYDGWCDAGCPIGALANPLVVHQPAARKHGAEFRAFATVTQVLLDKRGRADALAYRDQRGGEHVQPADLVVLAGAAVQNARLLLASDVANRSGLVGGYFTMHSIANAHGLFDEDTECALGLSAGTLTCQDDYPKSRSGPAFGSLTWGIAPAVKPNDLLGIAMTRPELFGEALHVFMRRAATRIGLINGIAESVPIRSNRVELAAERDANGVPLARIVHTHAPESAALWRHANASGSQIIKAAGAIEAWTSPMPAFAHLSGGTIMGKDPQASVTDSYGGAHDVPNLFIAGGGLFPTIGAVSPTFTLLALADRTAAHLLDRWGSLLR